MDFRIPAPTPEDFGAVLTFYRDHRTVFCRGDGTGAFETAFVQFRLSPTGDQVAWLDWSDRDTSTLIDAENDDDSEPGGFLCLTTPASDRCRKLTAEMHIYDFAWSHDATTIWFNTGGCSDRLLYAADVSSAALTELGPGVSPLPSPDGRHLAFMGLDPSGIELRRLDTGASRYIAPGMPAAWSRDGKRLLFLATHGQSWQIFCLDVDTLDVVHVAPDSPFSYWPSWAPDGEHILFETCPDGRAGPPSSLALANRYGDTSRRVTNGPRDAHPAHHPTRPLIAYQVRREHERANCDIIVHSLETKRSVNLGLGAEPRWLTHSGTDVRPRL